VEKKFNSKVISNYDIVKRIKNFLILISFTLYVLAFSLAVKEEAYNTNLNIIHYIMIGLLLIYIIVASYLENRFPNKKLFKMNRQIELHFLLPGITFL